jgi:hypothetical protein
MFRKGYKKLGAKDDDESWREEVKKQWEAEEREKQEKQKQEEEKTKRKMQEERVKEARKN